MVSAQRRSVHPNVPGLPWWGAVMIALTATAIGFAFDAGGGKELTHVFAALYAIGCIAAVLAVRQSAIFTAVVQPPMILFVAVPGAYFLLHDGKINGLKDVVINCAYPLVERFPLMLFTSGIVLLIGLARWFLGGRSADAQPAATAVSDTAAGLVAKITGLFNRSHDDEDGEDEEPAPRRRHAVNRSKSARSGRPATARRSEPTRRRRPRPSAEDDDEVKPERPRRPRPPADDDEPLERPRRSRPSASRRSDEPIDLPRRRSSRSSRNPYERREPYERRAPHERRSRYDSYDPFEAYEAPSRRRPGTNGAASSNGLNGTNGSNGTNGNGTHHPISRVRYRGSTNETEAYDEGPVRRRARPVQAETWEYDI
jgi:hypothetical protein